MFELSFTETPRHTEGHEFSIVAVDKPSSLPGSGEAVDRSKMMNRHAEVHVIECSDTFCVTGLNVVLECL